MAKREVIINHTAKIEEILAYFLLKDTVFKNKKYVFVGDDEIGYSDIFSADLEIGVEVVTCENLYTYIKRSKVFNDSTISFDEKKKIFFSQISYKKRFKMMKFYSNLTKEKGKEYSLKPNSVEEEKALYENLLKKNFSKKLKLLNEGKYYQFNKKYLFLMSDFKQKDFEKIEFIQKIFNEVKINYEKQFDKVFVLLNKKIFELSMNNNFDIKDILSKKQVRGIYKEVDFNY